jgi:hypothetical protein
MFGSGCLGSVSYCQRDALLEHGSFILKHIQRLRSNWRTLVG